MTSKASFVLTQTYRIETDFTALEFKVNRIKKIMVIFNHNGYFKIIDSTNISTDKITEEAINEGWEIPLPIIAQMESLQDKALEIITRKIGQEQAKKKHPKERPVFFKNLTTSYKVHCLYLLTIASLTLLFIAKIFSIRNSQSSCCAAHEIETPPIQETHNCSCPITVCPPTLLEWFTGFVWRKG